MSNRDSFEDKLKNSLFHRFCEKYDIAYIERSDGLAFWPKYDEEGKLDRSKTAIRQQ